MEDLDVRFTAFAKTIQKILRSIKSEAGFSTQRLAKDFAYQFETICPTLAQNFPKNISFLYAYDVIEFAVNGLGDKFLSSYWEGKDVQGYSIHTKNKHSQRFGIQIALHLVRKEDELKGETKLKVNPYTIEEYLFNTYNLSPGQIKVLLEYKKSENRGRKLIAKDLHLSENTIKSHVHSIMKKMKTESINEAVRLARKFIP
jgi:DNA-binding CsgD family transcriptional regulator